MQISDYVVLNMQISEYVVLYMQMSMCVYVVLYNIYYADCVSFGAFYYSLNVTHGPPRNKDAAL